MSSLPKRTFARPARSSSSGEEAQPANAQPLTTSNIAVFRHPVRSPQGWSLSPTRIVEAAEFSMQWIADGRPQLQARARAVHRVRCSDEESLQGDFLRTLQLTSATMSDKLLCEFLLVQNLVLQWSDEEDALVKESLAASEWYKNGAEKKAAGKSTAAVAGEAAADTEVVSPGSSRGAPAKRKITDIPDMQSTFYDDTRDTEPIDMLEPLRRSVQLRKVVTEQ